MPIPFFRSALSTAAVAVALLPFSDAFCEDQHSTEILLKGAPHAIEGASCHFQPVTEDLPYREGGELLRAVPGVTGGRMGGHGVEPVIRGQSQTQLNVTSDGAFVHGGCPNRMDPPSSLVNVLDADQEIRVTRGYQSVLQGPGASGGSIALESVPPQFDESRSFRLSAGSGYESNGDITDYSGTGALVYKDMFFRGGGFWKDADDYEDGSGNEVRSAFRTYGGKLEFGFTPDPNTLVSFGWENNRTVDALFAGAGMDAPETEADIFKAKAVHKLESSTVLKRVSLNAYTSYVDHVMDNYSRRTRTEGFMRAPSESNTKGGRLMLDLSAAGQPVTAGLDLIDNNRDARRYSNMKDPNNVSNLQSILWPDVTIRNLGYFMEAPLELIKPTTLTLGGRYDNVFVDAAAADLRSTVPAMMPAAGMSMPMPMPSAGRTPNELFQKYYGTTADFDRENNIGGNARLDHRIHEKLTLFTGLARAVRTADTTERALAGDAGAETWVGNPSLSPEKHHILDAGIEAHDEQWGLTVMSYYDAVNDYILRDRARGQDGILQSDGATVYRNIDASLFGVEMQSSYQIAPQLLLSTDLAYTRGEDEDSNRALPQIPPVFGTVKLTYKREDWTIGGATRFAAKQTRVDTDKLNATGRDAGETSGYGLVDLFASVAIADPIELRFGASNIFDKKYANHLNRSSAFDPEEIQVNEPGRSLFVQIRANL